jgi:tetratricopeptide (TPR) repeat protein
MPDAQLVVGRQLRELSALGGQQQAELIRLERQVASLISASGIAHKASERAVDFLTSRHCAATAGEFVMHQQVELRTWDWQRLDRLAAAWMHVGEPAQARELWNAASQAGFEAERLARLADSYLVERQFERAENLYGQALERDPRLVAARWALAMLHIQRGDATSAHRACQAALDCDPPPELQATLAAFKAMLERCR